MKLKGTAVSGGYAAARIFLYDHDRPDVAETYIEPGTSAAAVAEYRAGRDAARKELESTAARLEASNDDRAKIFKAQVSILCDEAIDEDICELINEEGLCPQWAVKKVFDKYANRLRSGRSTLIRERAADLEDVSARLIRCFGNGQSRGPAAFDGPVILAAYELMPSDVEALDKDSVLAIITETGGYSSHAAIIARSRGIPAVLGIPGLMGCLQGKTAAAVDACHGTVELDPDERLCAEYRLMAKEFNEERESAERFRKKECLSADGTHVDIELNIAAGTDEELYAGSYLDGIGLFRTEFLFMGRDSLPDEEEQYRIYSRVLRAYGGKPVTLRTLDIGGDKQTGCIPQPHEDNPFLGRRALRLCFDMPELFKTQIRASLRASVHGKLRLMLPMVASMDDIYLAREYIRQAEKELALRGEPFDPDYMLGIMVEIPSIAIMADSAAEEVDFASIGSNDLCQYTLAVDRLSPSVSKYYRPLDPAMLRLIKYTVDEFKKRGKSIGICGELGGEPVPAIALVGLGLRKLSMNLSSVAKIKKTISELSIAQMRSAAEDALRAKTAAEAEAAIRRHMKREE